MPVRILVTGFGPFPGAAANPSQAVLRLLARDHARALARAGIDLRLACLPVVHAGAQARLEALRARHKPHAVLHLGLAARRRRLTLEARACNRMSLLSADASGARAGARLLEPGGPAARRARAPLPHMLAALRTRGLAAALSQDAGAYLCNQTLYASLMGPIPAAAFLHLPRPRPPGRPKLKASLKASRRRKHFSLDINDLTLAAAVCARELRQYICGSITGENTGERLT
jgi:pyroglutamyl-peptidase